MNFDSIDQNFFSSVENESIELETKDIEKESVSKTDMSMIISHLKNENVVLIDNAEKDTVANQKESETDKKKKELTDSINDLQFNIQIKKLYEEMSKVKAKIEEDIKNASDEQTKKNLSELLSCKMSEYTINQQKIVLDYNNKKSSLPENIKNELADLYNELTYEKDTVTREIINFSIKQKRKDYNLSGEELSACIAQQITANSISYESELFELNMLKNSLEDKNEIINIENKIRCKQSEFDYVYTMYYMEYNNQISELPPEQLNELVKLYEELSETVDSKNINQIIAKVTEKHKEYKLSEKEIALSNQQCINSITIAFNKELSSLYNELTETSDFSVQQLIYRNLSETFKQYSLCIAQYR